MGKLSGKPVTSLYLKSSMIKANHVGTFLLMYSYRHTTYLTLILKLIPMVISLLWRNITGKNGMGYSLRDFT